MRRRRTLARASFDELLEEIQRRPEGQEFAREILLLLRSCNRALARRLRMPEPPQYTDAELDAIVKPRDARAAGFTKKREGARTEHG